MTYKPSTTLVNREFSQYLDKVAENVVLDLPTDPYRLFFLRPSSFPYCGLRFFLDFPQKLDQPRLQKLASAYFTEVGTLVHSIFQRFSAKRGKIVGDWKCVNKDCRHVIKFGTYTACPKCNSEMEYLELEFAYKKTVLGHSDTLYRFSPKDKNKGLHAIWDYKTTSRKKIDEDNYAESRGNKRHLPYKTNVAQIETYIPLTEAQYGVSVDYWSLIYLARDLPLGQGRKIITKAISSKEKVRLRENLDRTVKIHRKVLVAKKAVDVDLLQKYKLCSSAEDYKKNWHDDNSPCPFSAVCFKQKELNKTIKTTLSKHKVFPIIEHAPPKVRETLGL